MQDVILIEGLKVKARAGIHPWEKQVDQPLLFDLELTVPLQEPGLREDLSLSVDYAAVAEAVAALAVERHHDLIETLAERVCEHILSRFERVEAVTLTLRKPAAVPAAASVGLRIRRTR